MRARARVRSLLPQGPPCVRAIAGRYGAFVARYPLTDRCTFYYDWQSAAIWALFIGLGLPLVSIVGRKLGMDSGMLAVLSASPYAGFFLNLWFGHLSERGDKIAFVFWPSVIARGLVGAAAFAVSPIALLVVFCGYNVLSNLSGPAYSSIMRLNYSERYRGEIMGVIRILVQVLSAVAAALAGWIMERNSGSYRVIFPIAAALGVACSFIFKKVKVRDSAHRQRMGVPIDEADGPARPGFLDSLRSAWRDKPFIVFLAISYVMGSADKISTPLDPIRFVDELGMDYGLAGLIQGTIPFAAAILGYIILARYANRAGSFLMLAATSFLSSTRLLGSALAASPLHLIPGTFLAGLSNAGWELLPMFAVMVFAGPNKMSMYMGIYFFLVGVRGLIGPVIGIWLYEGLGMSLVSIYWMVFILQNIGTLAMLAFAVLRKRFQPPRG